MRRPSRRTPWSTPWPFHALRTWQREGRFMSWSPSKGFRQKHRRQKSMIVNAPGWPQEKKKDALRLLKSFSRVDERLVRTRLSHISEGHYDVNGDVVRPLNSKSKGEDEMEVTDEASCSFRRISAEMAKNAKANVRRRQPEEDDI
ncbi:unnamed protein product [Effrenium voratum]|nr:unnamed protein product [Effrenium voratum]